MAAHPFPMACLIPRMLDQGTGAWELRGQIRKRQGRGKQTTSEVSSTWMHIFFYEKMGNISETSTPQAFTIYGGPKNADINHPDMMAIGSLYYLMPGEDRKTALFAKVTEGMTQAPKHLRCLHIYAGFDSEFSEAQWINRREAEIRVPHPPSS